MNEGSAELDRRKRAAADAAVREVADGMVVGLGSGTTAAHAIRALGERLGPGFDIRCVPTSDAAADLARRVGLTLVDMADVATLDIAIDGVDEIDPSFRAIKGHGGAMLREKVVAAAAKRMIAIADASKRVRRLGAAPIPVEVLPFAAAFAGHALSATGLTPVLRTDGGSPVTTDQGNRILDCTAADLPDPAALAATIAAIPGVLAHGLFLTEIDALYVAAEDGVARLERYAQEATAMDGRQGKILGWA